MDEMRPIADGLEGIPDPAAPHTLVGHHETIRQLLIAHQSKRLHHAILLSGPKGIGKVTLAMRFAAYLFRDDETSTAYDNLETIIDPVQAKITAGAHPNMLHLTRPWDSKTKRFKTKLTVEEIRSTVGFFGTARGEDGWRVAIVDAVDDMNESANNALLKILEEPPERTLFFVIAHSMARVMPTIRSRCLHAPLKPLADEELAKVIQNLGVVECIPRDHLDLLVQLAEGSVRKAIILAREDGIELYQSFKKLSANLTNPGWDEVQTIADKICARGSEDRYFLFLDFMNSLMEAKATGRNGETGSISTLARWAEVWEKAQNSIRTTESYNLDRKQVILNLFHDMGEAART